MLRQVVLDTETTGIGHDKGHRLIEVGCVELIDRKLTGRQYQVYLNPQREVDPGAFRVHGISTAFLKDKPLFKEIVTELMEFLNGAELIIHNAPFDLGFLNAELKRVRWKTTMEEVCQIFDTLEFARKTHPGQRNNLDALCKRYEVNNSHRELHGALLDAQILAYLYLAMTGGQSSFFGELESTKGELLNSSSFGAETALVDPGLILKASEEELAAHQAFVRLIVEKSGALHWEEVTTSPLPRIPAA